MAIVLVNMFQFDDQTQKSVNRDHLTCLHMSVWPLYLVSCKFRPLNLFLTNLYYINTWLCQLRISVIGSSSRMISALQPI